MVKHLNRFLRGWINCFQDTQL
ncbi:MAG TPA: hypothetical protein PLH34_10020 [Bacillota bacterium]|nr:hypothetical protein [Bacillota bacterium]